jgi:hypothetical protein
MSPIIAIEGWRGISKKRIRSVGFILFESWRLEKSALHLDKLGEIPIMITLIFTEILSSPNLSLSNKNSPFSFFVSNLFKRCLDLQPFQLLHWKLLLCNITSSWPILLAIPLRSLGFLESGIGCPGDSRLEEPDFFEPKFVIKIFSNEFWAIYSAFRCPKAEEHLCLNSLHLEGLRNILSQYSSRLWHPHDFWGIHENPDDSFSKREMSSPWRSLTKIRNIF